MGGTPPISRKDDFRSIVGGDHVYIEATLEAPDVDLDEASLMLRRFSVCIETAESAPHLLCNLLIKALVLKTAGTRGTVCNAISESGSQEILHWPLFQGE